MVAGEEDDFANMQANDDSIHERDEIIEYDTAAISFHALSGTSLPRTLKFVGK